MAYIHGLLKMFSKREYAERFLQGELYARRLSSFRKLNSEDGRSDEYEGTVSIAPEGLVLTLQSTDPETGQVIRGINITEDDLDGPVLIQLDRFSGINLFCMYAVHSGGFTESNRRSIEDYEQFLRLSQECLELGSYTVAITENSEFIKRVEDAIAREGYKLLRGLVQYYDPEVGSPFRVDDNRIVLAKRKEFAWQREYRFAIDTGTNGLEPIILNIGPIDDIAMLVRTEDINRTLKIQLPQVS